MGLGKCELRKMKTFSEWQSRPWFYCRLVDSTGIVTVCVYLEVLLHRGYFEILSLISKKYLVKGGVSSMVSSGVSQGYGKDKVFDGVACALAMVWSLGMLLRI